MTRELCPGTLEHLIFEKVRRCGAGRAHGQRITHGGGQYDLTVNTLSIIETVHVVAERVPDESMPNGHQRAMAVVNVYDNGYRGGIEGSQYVFQALLKGVRVPTGNSLHHRFVLPALDVPTIFVDPQPVDDPAIGEGARAMTRPAPKSRPAPPTNTVASLVDEIYAAHAEVNRVSSPTDSALGELELGIDEEAKPAHLRQLMANYQKLLSIEGTAEGRKEDAVGRLLTKLSQPAQAPGCTADLTSAIELHSDEVSNELSRAADALERIADRLDVAGVPYSGSQTAS